MEATIYKGCSRASLLLLAALQVLLPSNAIAWKKK